MLATNLRTVSLYALTAFGIFGCGTKGCESAMRKWQQRSSSHVSTPSRPQPVTAGDAHYRIDQFGYLPGEEKVAVIRSAQRGFDAPDDFAPGAKLEVQRWPGRETKFVGAPVAWNGGATDSIAGDKGWWFDFSELREPGEYVIFDPERGKRSHVFRIGTDVYAQVLVQALRTFFYQRQAFDKKPPFADPRWSDGPSQLNDRKARSVLAKRNAKTERDMSGGWMDAGDQNKYVTFLDGTIPSLLYAYTQYPELFRDDNNIPESGNQVPDIIDEIDWEIQWLVKMQDSDGGVFLKVGALDTNDPSPPSADSRPRYYGRKCSSATISFAAILAQVALAYRQIPAFSQRVTGLTEAGEKAWDWLMAHPSLDEACDSGEVKSGDADRTIPQQQMEMVRAAVWLHALTGKSKYLDHLKANYEKFNGLSKGWWGPYWVTNDDAALVYAVSTSAEPAIKSRILESVGSQNGACAEYYGFKPDSALYRAYMPEQAFHWGSNMPRADAGNILLRMLDYKVNPAEHPQYLKRALQHLHWLHGVNALGLVYLSNMEESGAERSVDQFFHTWFAHGSVWDSVRTSPKGPAPGYLVGGPNTSYGQESWYSAKAKGMSPPYNQPPEKSYLDFNESELASYAVSENAIYYQASYIRLLAGAMHHGGAMR